MEELLKRFSVYKIDVEGKSPDTIKQYYVE